MYASYLVKIPVVFAPTERVTPVFQRLARRLMVVVFVIEFDVSWEALSGRYEKDKTGLGPFSSFELHKLMIYLSLYRR
jgi:hypothetical protein